MFFLTESYLLPAISPLSFPQQHGCHKLFLKGTTGMKRILKLVIREIYQEFISPYIVIAVFALTFYISYPLSEYNGGLPCLLSIIVATVFS